jgi:hypothetical protein
VLPTDHDLRLLKQENVARLRGEWGLDVQGAVLNALRAVNAGGHQRLEVALGALPGRSRNRPHVTAVREDGYEANEAVVDFNPNNRCAGSDLLWRPRLRVVISIEAPKQRWDRFGDS